MKRFFFLLLAIWMMTATSFSWSQEKIVHLQIPFSHQMGYGDFYDILTLAEVMAESDTLYDDIGPSQVPFTQQMGCGDFYDILTLAQMMAESDTLYGYKRELVLQALEEAFSASEDYQPEYEVPPYEVIVLSPMPMDEDAEDEGTENKDAEQSIVVKQDKDGEIISLYIQRESGWLRGDPEYGSLLYLELAEITSFIQRQMYLMNSQRLR